MIKNFEKLSQVMVERAQDLGRGCEKVFVAVSGGIDSSLAAAILCRAYGPENVVGLYRDIHSNPKHFADVKQLQAILGFRLLDVDLNPEYDSISAKLKEKFAEVDLLWVDEASVDADQSGFTNAFASFKSCLTTPLASFISKAIDGGRGRIFGTGNGEEDGLLRYFDKRGDGAVDNNILDGLNKAEVRQLARYLGVPENIITKRPSADLEGNGDSHNDEAQLTKWAKEMGYDIELSYGTSDGSEEGNIAWGRKQDIEHGVITGERKNLSAAELKMLLGYDWKQVQLILFLREMERRTRHKVDPIPGLNRKILMEMDLVD